MPLSVTAMALVCAMAVGFTLEGSESGPHCAIPKGTTAAGEVLAAPPPVPKSGAPLSVPLNGLT